MTTRDPFHAKALAERLKPLHAERTSREKRGVPVPSALTAAIRTIEGQLANEYNRHEHEENMPEAEFMKLQEPRQPADLSYRWFVASAAVCLVLAAVVAWWPR